MGGAPAVVGADLEVNLAPVSCRSPTVPSSVLSILNFNKMNKRSVNRVIIEESWSRKDYGVKGASWTRWTGVLVWGIEIGRGDPPPEDRNQKVYFEFSAFVDPLIGKRLMRAELWNHREDDVRVDALNLWHAVTKLSLAKFDVSDHCSPYTRWICQYSLASEP